MPEPSSVENAIWFSYFICIAVVLRYMYSCILVFSAVFVSRYNNNNKNASRLATRQNCPKSTATAALYVSLTLVRANVRAILTRTMLDFN